MPVATEIRRAQPSDFADTWSLLNEYFEAVHVQVRDDRETVLHYLKEEKGGIWLAYCGSEAAGCIALRPLSFILETGAQTGEVKRLYVKPAFRRLGLAAKLLAELESFSVSAGIPVLYLDSKDDLKEALVFYERAGYARCDRYNDNPQATVFLKKTLA